jgi:predicted metal-dependent hydrolase
VTASTGGSGARADRVLQGGRSKAYRPLPPDERRTAFDAGLAAYRRGDFFEAHELLEPAWMGTADPVERDLYQGLIKLAAAYVHAVRGNPAGVGANLRGARDRLAAAAASDSFAGGLDLPALVAAIDARLERGPAAAVARPLADAPVLASAPEAARR